MLTPAKIDEYSYNRVVKIYDDLNIEICKDIIDRIERMGDISQTSKDQIKILAELNGKEIFDEVLMKTSMLDNDVKDSLQKIYMDAVRENMYDYKPLYEYRNKEFKLTPKQIRILNRGIRENNKIIRNFTNSMAFNSKSLFIDSVDKAYLKVSSGAMDYNKAIYQSYKEIAEKGVTLSYTYNKKDKKTGKIKKITVNQNLDVAVRRSVLTGIQQTANDINNEVGEILGCDGYEVTAHIGARPSHAEAQGKQYALTREDAKKYRVGYWGDVSYLWEEPNCRHTVFPIILGISEPVYSKNEINKFNQTHTTLYGKRVPIYEATQQMRYIERNIREYKRQIKVLENKDHSTESKLLKKWQQEYTRVSKETGIEKDYARTRI